MDYFMCDAFYNSLLENHSSWKGCGLFRVTTKTRGCRESSNETQFTLIVLRWDVSRPWHTKPMTLVVVSCGSVNAGIRHQTHKKLLGQSIKSHLIRDMKMNKNFNIFKILYSSFIIKTQCGQQWLMKCSNYRIAHHSFSYSFSHLLISWGLLSC